MNRTDIEYIIEKLEFYRFQARSTIISGRGEVIGNVYDNQEILKGE